MRSAVSSTSLMIMGIFLAGLAATPALAEKMDLVTHNLLIQKLERVLDQLEDGDLSKSTISLRLADLQAEKARLLDMEDAEKGVEKNRAASQKSRREAIALYNENLKQTSQEKQGAILLQTAHLHELLGEDVKAEKLYDGVIQKRKSYSEEIVGKSLTARADISFRKAQYKKALSLFNDAFNLKKSPRKGYLLFRIAWCEFHEGNGTRARESMIRLLKSQELMKRKSDGLIDTALQEEASRDLATIMARNGIQSRDIQILSDLTPENIRGANLTYLATELDRTGRKKDALLVWSVIGQREQLGSEKLEGQIKIAQIQYDLGKKNETVLELSKALTLWKEEGCDSGEECQVLRQQLRKILTDWGKAEEREPSAQLVQAYAIYIKTFPDVEVNYWAGNAARKLKQYPSATQFYHQAADLAAEAINNSSKVHSPTRIAQLFEGALLSEIEVAELSGNVDLKDNAYTHYLKLNASGPQALKVRYQMAHVLSDRKQYKEAAEAFKAIALSKEAKDASLQEKSADLALDSLVLLKDDETLEDLALVFSKNFKHRSEDFQRIARQSALNQAARAFNNPENHSKLEAQLEKLQRLDLNKAPATERINVLKHIIMIAHQLKRIDQIDSAAAKLVLVPGLSAKDKDEAIERRAWVAELRLQFADALRFHEQIKNSKMSDDERTMKLAILAELAGKNPTSYYERYLRIGKLQSQRQWSAYQLLLRSKNKTAALREYGLILRGNSALFSKAALLSYQQRPDLATARQALAVPKVEATVEGRFFARILFLEKFAPYERDLANQRLNASSAKSLKSSLTRKLQSITRSEAQANRAIELADWTLQLKTLSTVLGGYKSLAKEIQSLPLPRGLKSAERIQYRQLLAQQASPYLEKAKAVQAQVDTLWKADENLDALHDKISHGSTELAKAASWELKIVDNLAKKTGHSGNVTLVKSKNGKSSDVARIAEAREQVQKNPFSLSSIEKLRNMERTRGRESMVAYLDGRIHELQERGQN